MDHVVEVELIDLAGIELGEAGAHVLEEFAQLALVIAGDQRTGGSTIGLLAAAP